MLLTIFLLQDTDLVNSNNGTQGAASYMNFLSRYNQFPSHHKNFNYCAMVERLFPHPIRLPASNFIEDNYQWQVVRKIGAKSYDKTYVS